jgi:DNA-binding MarR family transcriptional regulator
MPSGSTHELALALRLAYMALHRATDAEVSKRGVTADQFVVLAALSRGDALTQRELGERTSSDPSTLRAMLVLLEKKGLVGRQPHPRDGRARTVRLTSRGRELYAEAWSATEALRHELGKAVGSAQVGALAATLRGVARAMGPGRRANGHRSAAGREAAASTKGT